MAFGSSAAELLFRAKGDTDDARKEFSKLKSQIGADVDDIKAKGTSGFTSFAQSIGLSEGAAGKLAGALPIVGIADAAVGTAIVAAAVSGARALFDLTVRASEYGSVIFDVQQKTNLTAATIQTLKINADQSGSSLEAVSTAAEKFAKLMGAAADGGEKAQATLKKFGIESKDLDSALQEAFATIQKLPPGIEQITAAQQLFGKENAELIPVIKAMEGDLKGATEEARRLGVVLSEEDIRAADEFGDTLDRLGLQAQVTGSKFALEFAPLLVSGMNLVSEAFANNQDRVRSWGVNFADTMRGASIVASSNTSSMLVSFALWSAKMIAYIDPVQYALLRTIDYLKQLGQANRPKVTSIADLRRGDDTNNLPSTVPSINLPRSGGGGSRGGGGGSGSADKAAREAEARAKADLQAQIQIERDKLKDAEDAYKKTLDKLTEEYKKAGNSRKFIDEMTAALTKLREEAEQILPFLTDLEGQAAGGQTENQAELLRRSQEQRAKDLQDRMNASVDSTNKIVTDGEQKKADVVLKINLDLEKNREVIERRRLERSRRAIIEHYETEIKNGNNVLQNIVEITAFLEEQALHDRDLMLEKYALEKEERRKNIEKSIVDEKERLEAFAALDEEYKLRLLDAEEEYQEKKKEISDTYTIPADSSAPETPTSGIEQLGGMIAGLFGGKDVENLKLYGGLVDGLRNSFGMLAQAVGSSVKAFVLFGGAGTSFRKFAAELLASIAQMAAVQAIWNIAEGFAKLALAYFGHPTAGASATQHFIAAGVYGAIAGVAAVAGRAVAGSSFQQETSGAFGSAGSSGGNRDTAGQGRQFSSHGDEITVIESGVNQAMPIQRSELLLRLNGDGVLDVVEEDANRNGRMKVLIEKYS